MRAGDDELAGAVEMGQRLEEVRERRAAGNDLWLAEDDGGPLFRCWIYRRRAPVLAAPGGWLELPADTVVPRGLGHHPAGPRPRHRPRRVDGASPTRCGTRGSTHMITKVGVENEASRKAVAKAGFREIGVMRLVKRGPRKRTTVDRCRRPGLGADLAARLGRLGRTERSRARRRLRAALERSSRGRVREREQPVAVALRQPRDGRGDRQAEAHPPGVRGAAPVAPARREQARVTASQLA